jgi:hypothetical protein
MAAEREPPTLADYVVTALSPVLIMLMVGSLVFFLVTVLPTGDYKERLLYTTFFFVFGAVLVARIAIQYDAARATVYGAGLALVTFLAMSAYVEYPRSTGLKSVGWLLNLGLMGLIWWSAHKLTWDCTHIDENRDASGRGLLAAAGLGESGSESESENKDNEPVSRESQTSASDPPTKKNKKKRRRPPPFSVWVGRWREFREKRKGQPHTPGVWVIYFALAALPLFAVGQSLIPPDDAARRWATFAQMAVYVGSALGLLVTTSLLGLRRYLRQRKAKMPAALAAGWLGLGGVLIVVFLALGAFLPRPHSEVPWFGLPQAGKSERDASKYAQLRDSAGKGEGADGNVTEKGDGSAAGKNGEPGGAKGEKGSGRSKSNAGQKAVGEKGKDGDAKDGDAKDGENAKDGDSSDTDREGRDAKEQSGDRDRSGSGSPPNTKLGAAVQQVAGFLKWVVVAVVVFLVLVALVLGVLRYLAPFTDWARNLLDGLRNWWAGLFGKKKGRTREEEVAAVVRGPQRPPPFTAFSNPFEDGTAAGRDAAELVEYTFAALDSWAWDRGHGRPATETPLEFAARVGDEFPDLGATARQLAALYARVAYSDLPLPAGAPKLLEQVWDQLVHGATAAEPVEVE